MRRTVSMEHAKSILPTFPPPDIPTEEDDAEVEVTSFRTQPPSSDFSKPTQSKSYPQFCMPTSTPPSVFTHSQDLLLVTDTSIEPDTNNATTNTANTNSTSFTHVDNEKKLDVLSPSRSLEVPNSGSSTSLLSPRSVFSYDFNIPDNSNGIRLVASASELGGNKEIREDYWNATQTSMISSEALIPVQRESERSFFVEGSLESLEESERSNSSLMHPHCSEVPNDHASNSEGSSCEINYVHKRSFSADVLSADNDEQNDPKVETISHDRAHSQDSLPQTDPSQASYTSPDVPEIPRSVDEVHISGGSSNLDILNSSLEPLPDSPWVDDQLSPSRIFDFTDNRPRNHVDLPAISEETEQDPLPRSRELIELMKKSYNAEPFVCSPTTFSDKDESYNSPISSPPVPIHRRVVSDNHILYGNSNESVNRAEIRPREHLTRSGPVSSRCKSQVMLHKAEEHDESAKVDRNLSNSDPALNVEKDENEAPEVPSVPPPVVITRKNSSAQASSWQRFLPSGGANPHNVIIPTTANLPTRTIKRTESSVDNLNSALNRHVVSSNSSGPAANFMRRSLRFFSNVGARASGSPRSLDYDLISPVSSLSTPSRDEYPTLRRRATAPHRKSSRMKARSDSSSPSRSDRSRVEKKKEKGSSDTFFGNWLGSRGRGKKSKERPSVDHVFCNYAGRNIQQSASFPVRRPGDSHRPAIPAFAEETVCVPEGVVFGNDKCYITEAFLCSLGSSNSLTTPPTSIRGQTVTDDEDDDDISDDNAFISRRVPDDDDVDLFPPLRASSYPRSRRVSALIFHSLARTLSGRKLTLPDVMPSSFFKWRNRDSDDEDGLPDNISRVFSPTELDDVEPERTDLHSLLLENPKWSRLALFSDTEYQTWHEKYRHDKLSDKAIKKQDAIYELIMIERQHCANLVFLQQGYRMRLLEENILSQAEVNALIPDVIDALLLFHCNLLEQLLERQRSVDEIETISDILAKELSDEGTHTAVCINAYTTFGTSKQKAEQAYSILKVKNSKFNEILKLWETDKLYRRYEYKSIMAKIIGRPTKYRLLLETIARNESNKFSKTAECTEKAFQAAKRFALRIDQNLMVAQLARHWEKVRTHFDISSYTYLYIPDKASGFVRLKWTLDDICSEINENGRRLMCLGDVWWKVQSGGSCKLNPVTMALFDDILVLLVKKNTKMVFASTEQAVLPVSNLILRISGKGQSIMLASAVKPTLLEFEFHSKSDMAKWSSTLDTCINVVPTSVRLSSRNEDIISVQEEKKVKEEEEMWFRKLNKLFADRLDQERMLADYLVSRRKFLDEIRAHVFTLNCSGRSDLQERVREAIKVKFRDLKNYRTVPLNKMIDDITKARESELMNYFNNDFVDDADSDSSNSDSSSGKCVRPRRIKTFNGASGSVNNKEKLQLRRHTTVPRMSESSEAGIPGFNKNAEDEKREKEVVDEQIHLIPLSEPISSRRGCTRLIKDCERLKTENILLKNELALEKIRVTTLERGRPNFSPTVTAPGETMEALRKKEKEVREEDARRRSEIEEKRQEMAEAQAAFEQSKREWQEQMDRDKADLLRREQDIAEKWSKLKEAESRAGRLPVSTPTRIPFDKEPKTPPIQELSPLLKSLTVKSEPKRKK